MKVVWHRDMGLPLNAEKVKTAREDEMAFMAQFGVTVTATREECLEAIERKPIPTWVDVNKGDSTRPELRS
eukprot:7944691-Prorocentrum_lima.AAC.1